MIQEIQYRDQISTRVNIIDPEEHLQSFWNANSFYESGMLDYIYENYPSGLVYFDIGACIGNHTLFFLNYMNPEMVHSFEPVPELYHRLIDNMEMNKKEKCKAYNLAFGVRDETLRMIQSDFSDNVGMSKISFNGDFEVDVRSLDSFVKENCITKIGLIKIDIEGGNKNLLRGAERTLTEMSPDIFIESFTDFNEVDEILRRYEYSYTGVSFNYTPTYLYKKGDSAVHCINCGKKYFEGGYRHHINNDYSIIKCDKCGLEYTDPIPTETILETFYSQYKDIRADKKVVLLNAQEHLTMLTNKYGWTPESTILDFGSGSGIFVELAGEKCYGVELQTSNNNRIKQASSELPSGHSWDFITLWGVLEHLPNPKQTIGHLVSLLHEGGIIALTTINAEGTIPYYYKPPEHLSYWTRAAFDILSENCGLEIVEYEPYWMFQKEDIYFQRLLSRTPKKYHEPILAGNLPQIIYVPTNEIRVVMKKLPKRGMQ